MHSIIFSSPICVSFLYSILGYSSKLEKINKLIKFKTNNNLLRNKLKLESIFTTLCGRFENFKNDCNKKFLKN